MKMQRHKYWVILGCAIGMVALSLPEAEARGRARGGSIRSHGSVRQSGAHVSRTGPRSATVTRGTRVATPGGTRTVSRSGTVHRGPAVAHPRANVADEIHDAHRRARVRHAVGHAIRTLPHGYRTVYVGTDPYYYYGGVYYVKRYVDGSTTYVVVRAPTGAVIRELPHTYSTVVVSGRTYYSDGTVYYTRAYKNGEVSYVLVEGP